jgi:MSHA biogenesis protein MshN
MSLLNDMLHDLSKQKPPQEAPALFHPVQERASKVKRNIALVCVLVLSLLTLSFVLIKYQLDFRNTRVVQTTQTIASAPIAQPRTKETLIAASVIPSITTTPLALSSYIEPISAPTSFREDLVEPSEVEFLAELSEEQDEAIEPTVTKVYAPQTLEEWHNAQLTKALNAIEQGFDEKAIAILQGILVKMPSATDVRENLVALYLSYSDYSHASQVVNDGLKYAPADATLITIQGRILLDQGKASETIKLLSAHRPSMTSYPDFYAIMAAALQSEGRITEAGTLYKSLLQIDPYNGQYWLGYAMFLENNNETNQAIQAYTRASQSQDAEPLARDYAENRLKALQG